jgi:hypothetical protein
MFGMSQQQQVALIQQMAQLQLMNQAAGIQKTPNQMQQGIQTMAFPNMPGYVVIPQNQLAQLQQLQEQQLRQQLQQQQDQIKKYENETKHMLKQQQNNTQNNKVAPVKSLKTVQTVQPRALPKRVLVTRVPAHLKTVEQLADVFYPYGIISEIQIFKEKSQLPQNLIDIIEKVDPRPNSMPAATVEFETSQAAKFAVSIMRKREKQLQFRVALLKGDGVDEKHCHNYDKFSKMSKKKNSDVCSILSSDAEHISSGYESSCSKSSANRNSTRQQMSHRSMTSSPPSESSLPESEGDYDTFSDSNSDSNHAKANKLGPIAPPTVKKTQKKVAPQKMKKSLKHQPVSQFAKYRSQQKQ